eukprot:6185331-Pleurochrysis_carterae.AAC.2
MDNNLANAKWIAENAVLDLRHADINEIKYSIVKHIPWIAWDLKTLNASASDEAVLNLSTDSVNDFNPPELPKHPLVLNPNMPMLLIRNLNAKNNGLCNGACLLLVVSVCNNQIREAVDITPGPF